MSMEFPSPFEVPSIGMGNFALVLLLFGIFMLIILIMLLWLMFRKRA